MKKNNNKLFFIVKDLFFTVIHLLIIAITIMVLVAFLYLGKFLWDACHQNQLSYQLVGGKATCQAQHKMRKFLHNKLWRDKGPARMQAVGSIVHVKDLDDQEYEQQLGLKLIEEAHEVVTAQNKEELISEIGDVLEVIDCIVAFHGLSGDEITQKQAAKRNERGSYRNRMFVTTTESIPGSYLDIYCSKSPEQYTLISD